MFYAYSSIVKDTSSNRGTSKQYPLSVMFPLISVNTLDYQRVALLTLDLGGRNTSLTGGLYSPEVGIINNTQTTSLSLYTYVCIYIYIT